ncbi:MAG: FlgD immunoglobulin-like domain containing protein [bacterium]
MMMNYLSKIIKKSFINFNHRFLYQTNKSSFFCFLFFLPLIQSGSVIISWDPNKESDLSGYKIYFGTASRSYEQVLDVGNVTSHRISDLESGMHFFFTVTAYDFSGNESVFSEEVNIEIPDTPSDSSETEQNEQVLQPLVYNFPNPFKVNQQSTSIRYELLESSEVTIAILDLKNHLVKTLFKNVFKNAGVHTEDSWDGMNSNGEPVANGVYFCKIQTSGGQRFIKVAVTR